MQKHSTKTPPQKPVFTLTLTPEGACDQKEAFRRLRAALKCLLRSFQLRCTSVIEAKPSESEVAS